MFSPFKSMTLALLFSGLLAGCGSSPAGGTEEAATATTPLVARVSAAQEVAPEPVPIPSPVPLGVNMDAQADYGTQETFVDCIKTSRRFFALNSFSVQAPVDEHGWPTSDFSVQVFVNQPSAEGTYALTCQGRCDVRGGGSGPITVANLTYDQPSNTTRALVTLGSPYRAGGTGQLVLHFTRTDGGVKNLRLIRPGYPADTRQTFTNEFMRKLQPFALVRDVQWCKVIDGNLTRWEDRPHYEDAQQAGRNGVCYEYLIKLANESGKDLWICIPDQVDDESIRQLALLLKAHLDPERKVFLEWSNEVWNYMYPVHARTLALAVAESNAGPCALNSYGQMTDRFNLLQRYALRRTVRSAEIFASVFGQQAMLTTIRPVLAGQFGDTYHPSDALAWGTEQFGPLNTRLYGLASAPYFTMSPEDNRRTDLTTDEILTKLNERLQVVISRLGFDPNWNGRWDYRNPPTWNTLAHYYRLQSLAYEGGPDTPGPESLEAKKAANLDPRMGAMIDTLMRAWYNRGNNMFVYFNFAAPHTQLGQAGLYQDLDVETVKSYTILNIIRELRNGSLPQP